jgi:hypothetical protein
MVLWKIAVQTAVMERNPEMVQRRVWDAEFVLFERWQQLAKNDCFEDLELRKAAKVLAKIQSDRLGYPVLLPENVELEQSRKARENVLNG